MLDRLKKALIESYIGTIALGLVFSEAVRHFIGILAVPLFRWESRMWFKNSVLDSSPRFSLRDGLSELVQAVLFFVIGYLLLRWLYYPRAAKDETQSPSEEAPAASRPL